MPPTATEAINTTSQNPVKTPYSKKPRLPLHHQRRFATTEDSTAASPASPSSRTEYTGHRAIDLPPQVVGLVVYGQEEMKQFSLPREKFQA